MLRSFVLEKGQLTGSTNIGERGITISGGQRQRICIARAAYADADIVLLDDPLSAVDAHVGHHLLSQCILSGPMAAKTRILVTHHLDVLPHADMVLMMESDGSVGRIIQQGTYQVCLIPSYLSCFPELTVQALMATTGPFQSLIQEYGSNAVKDKTEQKEGDDRHEQPKGDSRCLRDQSRQSQVRSRVPSSGASDANMRRSATPCCTSPGSRVWRSG